MSHKNRRIEVVFCLKPTRPSLSSGLIKEPDPLLISKENEWFCFSDVLKEGITLQEVTLGLKKNLLIAK